MTPPKCPECGEAMYCWGSMLCCHYCGFKDKEEEFK